MFLPIKQTEYLPASASSGHSATVIAVSTERGLHVGRHADCLIGMQRRRYHHKTASHDLFQCPEAMHGIDGRTAAQMGNNRGKGQTITHESRSEEIAVHFSVPETDTPVMNHIVIIDIEFLNKKVLNHPVYDIDETGSVD